MKTEAQAIRTATALTCTLISAGHVSREEAAQAVIDIARELAAAANDQEAPTKRLPAVPIEDSVTDEHIICLEDGRPFQMLKRHLRTHYGLTPEQYRERWGLPANYPMTAPACRRRKAKLAKLSGLGMHDRKPAKEWKRGGRAA